MPTLNHRSISCWEVPLPTASRWDHTKAASLPRKPWYTGILAARNVLGANHNLWEVNEEIEYLEEFKMSDTDN